MGGSRKPGRAAHESLEIGNSARNGGCIVKSRCAIINHNEMRRVESSLIAP